MAVIHTLVRKSEHIKAFDLRQTLAGVWDLTASKAEPPHPDSTFHLDMKNDSGESVVGDEDGRDKVDEKDFMPGGKYRRSYYSCITLYCVAYQLPAIVKPFLHYEFQQPGKWVMGTGWLLGTTSSSRLDTLLMMYVSSQFLTCLVHSLNIGYNGVVNLGVLPKSKHI